MAKIELKDVQTRKRLGLEPADLTGIEPGKITGSNRVQSQVGRSERIRGIMDYVESNPGSSRTEIARGIGMKKAGYFVALLDGLVEQGVLSRHCDQLANGLPVYRYQIAD